MSLNNLTKLNERLTIEIKVINDIKNWLILVKSDETYWPFNDYLHHKEIQCIEYDSGEFKLMVYYNADMIYDYEVLSTDGEF